MRVSRKLRKPLARRLPARVLRTTHGSRLKNGEVMLWQSARWPTSEVNSSKRPTSASSYSSSCFKSSDTLPDSCRLFKL